MLGHWLWYIYGLWAKPDGIPLRCVSCPCSAPAPLQYYFYGCRLPWTLSNWLDLCVVTINASLDITRTALDEWCCDTDVLHVYTRPMFVSVQPVHVGDSRTSLYHCETDTNTLGHDLPTSVTRWESPQAEVDNYMTCEAVTQETPAEKTGRKPLSPSSRTRIITTHRVTPPDTSPTKVPTWKICHKRKVEVFPAK